MVTYRITYRITHRRAFAGVVAGLVLWAAPAAAQRNDGANIHLNAFRPALDSRGYVTVNASQVLGHNELSFGLVFNWSRNLLLFEQQAPDATYSVENIITPTLVGAYGLKLGPAELELGLSLPFMIMDGDRQPDDLGEPGNPNDDENFRFDGQGLGDVGVHLKTRLLNTSSGPGIGLAVIGSVYLPTASDDDKWLGEGSAMPQILGVVDKEFGDQGRFKIALTGGLRLRKSVTFVDNDTTDMAPVTGATLEAGMSVPVGVGIAYALSPQRFDIVGEVYGDLPLEGENYFPVDALAGIKVYLARNSFLSLGAGGGTIMGDGASPDLRVFGAIIFEPNIGDRDGDGIKDDVDKCPSEAEDRDSFEDEDGCPDPDNDRDGIPDEDDECPNKAEDFDGWQDEDGCPEGNDFDRDGDGIKDNDDKCPDDPEDKDGFEDEDGCPDPDNDDDGILDEDDLCINEAEDFDKFEDEDGCPDPDNDRDRILDEDDQCPIEPETYNGFRDDDGCPDRGRVVVTETNIEILDKVYFEYNKATIKPESFPILDAVGATLQGNPDIQLVEIQGHTDARGNPGYNLRLSDDRSKSVRKYLIGKGVEADRLRAKGYGETVLIDPSNTEDAHAKNRRVEFLIIKRATDE
jgi:OOP family OmpA-OmpF porin